MLKRLRATFVALNMAMVAAVLVAALAAICVISFQQDMNDVFYELDSSIVRSGQSLHAQRPDGTMPPGGEALWPRGEDAEEGAAGLGGSEDVGDSSQGPSSEKDGGLGAPPEIGGREEGGAVIPVVVCEVEDDGSLSVVSLATTATIADDVLDEASQMVAELSEGQGTLDGLGLLYVKRSVESETFVAFADKGSVSDWRPLALTLAVIGGATLLALFAVAVFFSRWAFRPVEESWHKQRQFVADASHELKTPLTVILANSSIISEHPERTVSSQAQWLKSTQQEAERMQELVGELLELARLDADDGKKVFARVDASSLVESEALQFESVAYERSVEMVIDVEPGVTVCGDEKRLRRLVAILLDNACKYANEGGVATVSLRADGKNAELRVHNTGDVIASEDIGHVFDRFFRADKARTREVGGFGLGLAIAREIVKEHGGTIAAESDEGGTTFAVRIAA